MISIALVGQPNCGKSTLFNSVAGYKTVVSNYPGSTMDFSKSRVRLNGQSFELVDVPGIYSLSSSEPDERVAIDYLLAGHPDTIINIVDASILSRSLELTLELLELHVPLVLCLNMIDEAKRKGIEIDVPLLEQTLGIPVVCTIASRGHGVPELFHAAVETAQKGYRGKTLLLSLDVEQSVNALSEMLEEERLRGLRMPRRFLALKLLERVDRFERAVLDGKADLRSRVHRLRAEISSRHGRPADVVLSSERHSLAVNLFEHVAQVRPRSKKPLREKVDRYVMHPFWGYVLLGLILFTFFNVIFRFGSFIEEPLLEWFKRLAVYLESYFIKGSLTFTVVEGLTQGFSGGIAIVLPYLIPFLIGLALLEDIGYLPRAAFLMDAIMHRIGLHGKAIFPFVMGYGCNVPAIMSVKSLENSRDRFIASALVCFVPCAARSTIIFALVAYYLGPNLALLLYILNLLVIGISGNLLSRMRPESSAGLIMQIPTYQIPGFKAVANKVWFRLREFIVLAWPLLIAGSVILSLLDYFELFGTINRIFYPFTGGLLGLPSEVSITLIFGILRKELSLIMLVQALGTSDFAAVMSEAQIMVFTAFTMFYMPCLATLAMLRSVVGNYGMIFALAMTTAVATVIAVLFRIAYLLLT